MTEEEQKAIKIVEDIAFSRGIRQDADGKCEDLKAIKDVFRLVDNKQKEIEIYIENNAKIKQLKEEKKGKNLFNGNVIISKDNIPENMFISITKEQYAEYMQQKETIEKQQKEIEEIEELKENQIWSEATIEGLKMDFIHKDKIREILQIEGNADIETYLKTIVAENNRLENIEDDRDCNYISKEKIREVIGTPYPEIAIDNLLKLLEE